MSNLALIDSGPHGPRVTMNGMAALVAGFPNLSELEIGFDISQPAIFTPSVQNHTLDVLGLAYSRWPFDDSDEACTEGARRLSALFPNLGDFDYLDEETHQDSGCDSVAWTLVRDCLPARDQAGDVDDMMEEDQ